jgi:transposase
VTPGTAEEPKVQDPSFAARIGLDWADQKHFWSMLTADGKRTRGELEQTPEAIQVWAAELAQRFPGRPIAVALEQSRGAVTAILSKYAHLHLFPVHPNTLAHYRESFYPSGAKSDPCDADLILEVLVKHPEHLRSLQPDTAVTRTLQFLVEERRKLVDQRTSEVQILTNWLKQVFPQILRWFDDVSTPLVGDLLMRWPTLPQLQKASPEALRQFLYEHNCRSEERIEERLQEVRQAIAATDDPALVKVGTLRIQTSVRLLSHMRIAVEEFDREIQLAYESHPDRHITDSLPGAGKALEPRLIAALGTRRERFDSASSMACCFGIAPVTAASGNSRWVHWRWACSKFVRQTFHEWARCSIRFCDWARQHYDCQRDKGKAHHAAVRSLAFKWIRILYRCWRDRVPYDDKRYTAALQSRNAQSQPLATDLANVQWKNCAGFSKPVKFS